MYIFIVLMLMGVKSNGTATLSFIFPAEQEEEIFIETEKISEPLVSVSGVVENDGVLEIDLVSREELEISFDVLYDDGSIESYASDFIDGFRKLKVPVVLSGSRRKIRWVNIFWEGDSLVIFNVTNEKFSDLLCAYQNNKNN
ncbi:hypothetical protein JW879_05980 [candidate division WOR-3 bacterium]|nr:hypothetical protein [candidate division WOR-3 bacterium]